MKNNKSSELQILKKIYGLYDMHKSFSDDILEDCYFSLKELGLNSMEKYKKYFENEDDYD